MNLNKSQKKYIHNNLGKKTINNIAEHLGIDPDIVKSFLIKTVPDHKHHILESELKNDKSSSKHYKFVINNSNLEKIPHEGPKITVNTKSFWYDISRNKYTLVALFFVGFILYVNSLANDFVSDDIPTIKNNPNITKPFVNYRMAYFSIRTALNSFIYSVFKLNPIFYRLPNLLLHGGSCVFVYLILNRLFSKRIALIGSFLFAVHPMQTESITWISGAPYSQSGFFILMSFYFYIVIKDKFNPYYYFASFMSFIGALYSDAKVVVMLGVFVLFDLLFVNVKSSLKKLFPYLTVGVYVLWVNFYYLTDRVSTLSQQYQIASGYDNPFVQIPISVSGYLQLYFWPQYLSLYQTEITIMNTPEFVVRCIVTVIFFALYILSFFKSKRIFFLLSFFFISMIPYLTPLRIAWYVAERYAYIATFSIVAIFAIGFDYLLRKFKDFSYGFYTILIAVYIIFAIRIYIRNTDWKNEDVLWFATYKTSPSGYQIHNNMGDVYSRRQDYETAAKFFKNATLLKPDYAAAYHNLGITNLRLNKISEAEENFKMALKFNPTIWQSNLNLGSIYFSKGDIAKAKEYLLKAYSLNPNETTVLSSMGVIAAREADKNKAMDFFTRALKADPNSQAAKAGLKALQEGISFGQTGASVSVPQSVKVTVPGQTLNNK